MLRDDSGKVQLGPIICSFLFHMGNREPRKVLQERGNVIRQITLQFKGDCEA